MPLPRLNTQNLVPDFAGAHQNALRSQGQMMQNQLLGEQVRGIPQQQQMDATMLELKKTSLDIQRKALAEGDPGKPISIGYPEFTVKGPAGAVAEIAGVLGEDPNRINDPVFPAFMAEKGVSYEPVRAGTGATPPELTKLISARDQLPEGDPRRKFYEDRINKISTDSGDKAPALSQIGKLMAERDALPPGDPGRKSYNDRIKKLTSEKPDVQTDIKGERALAKEFTAHPEVSSFMKIEEQYQRATVAIGEARKGSGSMNAVDQSLIQLLNRILDPGSVVRESEYARTPEGMAVIDRMQGYYGKLTAGGAGLSKDEREALYTMIDKFYTVAQESFNEQVDYYTDLSNRYGIPPENIIRLGGTKAGGKYTRINTAGGYLDKFKDK